MVFLEREVDHRSNACRALLRSVIRMPAKNGIPNEGTTQADTTLACQRKDWTTSGRSDLTNLRSLETTLGNIHHFLPPKKCNSMSFDSRNRTNESLVPTGLGPKAMTRTRCPCLDRKIARLAQHFSAPPVSSSVMTKSIRMRPQVEFHLGERRHRFKPSATTEAHQPSLADRPVLFAVFFNKSNPPSGRVGRKAGEGDLYCRAE